MQGKDLGEGENVNTSESGSRDKRDSHDNKVPALGLDLAKDKEPSKAEVIPRKTRLGRKKNKTISGTSSSKPAKRRRSLKHTVIGDEPIQHVNRRVTRSMSKKAAEREANTDAEPSSSKKAPEPPVTRSRSKAAASAKKH